MAQHGRRLILWFRNDLRLHDNYIVQEALCRIKSEEYDQVLPVYCFDPRFYQLSPRGTLKTGAYRAKFLLEAVADLKARLRAIGSDLVVSVDKPETVIPGLLVGSPQESGLVLTHEECTSEERAVDGKVSAALKGAGRLHKLWGHTMYHRADLPFNTDTLANMPDVFTPFKDAVERRSKVRADLPPPAAGQLPLPPPSQLPAGLLDYLPSWDDLPFPDQHRPQLPRAHPDAVLDFKGGESAALERVQYYLWQTDLVASYFDTRNGMLGGDFSSKFAPWLAAGCLSPRYVYHQVKRYEAQRTSNKSTYWLIFEMIWRDFFRFYALKHGSKIFLEGGVSGRKLNWTKDEELWRRWREGRTGQPLVDANMRELAQTGWMSNRGRQNVASYLVLDLGVDWRRGADLFESLLLDYDVASNWGNWVAAAGLTGGRINHFNITKQAKDYDPAGDYVRRWLPELRRVSAARIHEPWLMAAAEQQQAGVHIGVDYPAPVPAAQQGRPWSGVSVGGGARPGAGPQRSPAYGSGSTARQGGSRPGSGRSGYSAASGSSQFRKSAFERFG